MMVCRSNPIPAAGLGAAHGLPPLLRRHKKQSARARAEGHLQPVHIGAIVQYRRFFPRALVHFYYLGGLHVKGDGRPSGKGMAVVVQQDGPPAIGVGEGSDE